MPHVIRLAKDTGAPECARILNDWTDTTDWPLALSVSMFTWTPRSLTPGSFNASAPRIRSFSDRPSRSSSRTTSVPPSRSRPSASLIQAGQPSPSSLVLVNPLTACRLQRVTLKIRLLIVHRDATIPDEGGESSRIPSMNSKPMS